MTELVNTSLVLQTGSRAGLEAPMHVGYYMIGRHKECQIRPKSRSVSRHHCLLHRLDDGGLRVLDLESTSGTHVNEDRVEVKTWVPLNDGDQLRCGKIVFSVSMEAVPNRVGEPQEVAVAAAASGSMLRGDAWQEADIAEYLDLADEADRERRYESIRGQSEHPENHQDSDVSDVLDVFDDEFADEEHTIPTKIEEESEPVENPKPAKKKGRVKTKAATLPKKRPKKVRVASSGGSWIPDLEQLKMIGAVLLTVFVLGALGYSAHRFISGPEIRVLQGID